MVTAKWRGTYWNGQGGFEAFIAIANPAMLIEASFIDRVQTGETEGYCTLKGNVLTFEQGERKLVYMIQEFVPQMNSWFMEWPD